MASASVCRCICGTGERDPLDANTIWATPELDDVDDVQLQLPQFTGRLSYSISTEQPLSGQPMRQGELWFLHTENEVDPVNFTLYVNGFSFWHDRQETTISLSPFALVRNCKFQSTYPGVGSLADFKIFKVSMFAQGHCYYFGVKGASESEAEDERSRWVLDISRAMRLVTQSLFPPYMIACEPLADVASTHRRLMAGYLLHCDDCCVASVLYCELHAHYDDRAKMVLYENEICQMPVMDVYITERTICCEKIGINCSCFSIEEHQFSTRSLAERKLWLRAISNLKVKLQNRAPNPTGEELKSYRGAIKDHLRTIRGAFEGQGSATDALLQRAPHRKLCPGLSSPTPPPEVSKLPLDAQGLGYASVCPPSRIAEMARPAGYARMLASELSERSAGPASSPMPQTPAAVVPGLRVTAPPALADACFNGNFAEPELPLPATLRTAPASETNSRTQSTIGPRLSAEILPEVPQMGGG